MVRLVASDIDGTLLQHGNRVMPNEVFDEINRLTDMGILFVAASGRQLYNLQNLFAPVQDKIAYVCENGALTYYKGEILNLVKMQDETAKKIIRRLESEEGTEALVSGTYKSFIHPKEALFEEYIKKLGNQYEVVPDLTAIGEPYIKLALFENAGTEERERQKYWQAQFPEPIKVVTSGAKWLDILFPEMHKGVGIKVLQEKMGISAAQSMAFGDNFNDVEMFEACGIKVAVENAKQGIRDMSDAITRSVPEYTRKHVTLT